jgi:hypothetical protein
MSTFTNRLVNFALGEWDFFERPQYNLNGTTKDGKKEHHDGAWQRIGDYWKKIGGAYVNLTGKDRGTPWSAAFISYCMDKAGADNKFEYSAGHSRYINAAIRAANANNKNAAFRAHRKADHVLKPGDLVGYWRGSTPISIDNALSIGSYQSHTDVVVEVGNKFVYVIGGNVGHSVTRKQLRTNDSGHLVDTGYKWFVVMENQL